jgi:molybdopterin-containing oxidoreductase family molybdopterin binding subunit
LKEQAEGITLVRTVCDPNCGANPKCGLLAHVKEGRIVKIEPAGFHESEFDRICLMGMTRLEYVYHKDRLLHPLMRVGERGKGEFKQITWNEAFDIIIERLRDAISKYGAKACYFRNGSGTYGTLTSGSGVRFATAIGATSAKAGGIDYGVPKGLEYMFGVPAETYFRFGGHEFRDVVNTEYLIVWGANLAETTIVDFHFLLEAQRRGMKMVVIDINRTTTATKADEWISPRPGSDAALGWGMLNVILENKLYDEDFLIKHTNAPFLVRGDNGRLLRPADISSSKDGKDGVVIGSTTGNPVPAGLSLDSAPLFWKGEVSLNSGGKITCSTVFQLVKSLAEKFHPDEASRLTEVPAGTITGIAKEYAASKAGSIRIGYGVDRWYYSDYTSRVAGMLAACTGNIGKPGGGISVVAGNKGATVDVGSFRYPAGFTPNRMNLMTFYDAVIEGKPYPVRFLWAHTINMFNQAAANRRRVLNELIPKLEFIVVTEHFMTDTARYADIVLPACTIFERLDLVPWTHLQIQQKVIEPLGEARSDFQIFKEMAKRMGVTGVFDKTEEEFVDELLANSRDAEGQITVDRLRQEGAILPLGLEKPYYGFADLRFSTPSGRIEFYNEKLLEHGAELPYFKEPYEATPQNPDFTDYPLTLVFSHSKMRVHSTFVNMPSVARKTGEPYVQINPADATSRGVSSDDLVKVFNKRGQVKLKARLDENVRKGVVVITSGWWASQFIEGDPYQLTHDKWSPTSENFSYFDTLVQVEKTSR